jgi:hypothetical protein
MFLSRALIRGVSARARMNRSLRPLATAGSGWTLGCRDAAVCEGVILRRWMKQESA